MTQHTVGPYALALYLRQLATLLSGGVPLLVALEVIDTTLRNGAMKAVNAEIMREIEDGKTVSDCMVARPEVFSRLEVAMVRAGEIGGVLDETTHRLADYLETRLELRERAALWVEVARARGAEPGARERVETALDGMGEGVAETLFWRALGEMLAAGVPQTMAVDCAADLFEGDRREAIKAASNAPDPAGLIPALEATGVLSDGPLELCRIGARVGALDLMCAKAAQLLETAALAEVREAMGSQTG